jgi:hypothetical protein
VWLSAISEGGWQTALKPQPLLMLSLRSADYSRFAKMTTCRTPPDFGAGNTFGSNMPTAAVPGGNRIKMAEA